MARATTEETTSRIDQLQGLLLAGEPNTACLEFARQQWAISRAQGYKLLKRAWAQIKADVDKTGIDRQEMLALLAALYGDADAQQSTVVYGDWLQHLTAHVIEELSSLG